MKDLREHYTSSGDCYVTIKYDESRSVIIDTWTGYFGSQENFKNGILSVIEFMTIYECKYWIADLRAMKGGFDQSREWLGREIMPVAAKLGLQKEAIILPANVFSKLSTSDTIAMVEGIEIKQFNDIEIANEWIGESLQNNTSNENIEV